LEKLITLYYNQKLNTKESEAPEARIYTLHLRNLLSYKHYYCFGTDGNAFYRIIGIHHLYWMLSNPAAWDHMLAILESERFDIYMLTNVSPDFMPYFKKPKLLELFKGLVESIRKKL
jgi:hypothetical protein